MRCRSASLQAWPTRSTSEPPSHAHARAELKKWRIEPKKILRVDPDCVIYTEADGRVMTAWARRRKNSTLVYVTEVGMPCDPDPYIDDRIPNA